MGKTYRKGGSFRPKKGRGFEDLKSSRKFKDQKYFFDKYEKDNSKKPLTEEVPPIVIEEDPEL